ncbi:MAG TPA: hypothetical protein ENI68_02180 [Gammaproteobacteria bacterium]|nr:hypothetical protein [Gammaproteobacteria bacterium]
MKAEQLLRQRLVLSEDAFAEMVVWRVPSHLQGSEHAFKYRLAYVVDGQCLLRFDNEPGKGDHYHLGDKELAYKFESLEKLLDDFWKQVDTLRGVL